MRTESLKKCKALLITLLTAAGTIHLIIAAFRYVIRLAPLKKYEYIGAAVIFTGALICLILSFTRGGRDVRRFRTFISGMMSYEQIFMLLFTGWSAVSFLVNRSISRPGFTHHNEWYLFDVFVNAALLFPLAKILTERNARRVINAMMLLVLLPYSAFTIYGLRQVLSLNFIKLPSGSNLMMRQSTTGLQLGSHYNITGMQALLMLVLCLYFLASGRKKLRFLLLPLIPVQLFAANISNSRTVFVTGLIVIPLYLFLYIINRRAGHISRKYLAAAVCAAAAAFTLYYFSRPLSFYLFEKISGYSQQVIGSGDGVGTTMGNIRKLNNLSGRVPIWKSCLKAMLHDPVTFFFGVTPSCITQALTDIGGYPLKADHAHNMVLQTGMSAGVPAMLAYCVFLVSVCRRCLGVLFSSIRVKGDTGWQIPVLILSLTVPCLVEYYISSYHVMAGLFSLLAGLVLLMNTRQAAETRSA